MTQNQVQELATIIRAVGVISPTSFSFAGRVINSTDGLQRTPATVQQNPLVARLQDTLYEHCFCNKFEGTLQDRNYAGLWNGQIIEKLSYANASRDRWEQGWQAESYLPSGQVVARKDGIRRIIESGRFASPHGADRQRISIFMPRESRTAQSGFYFAYGETLTDQIDEANFLRFYWNLSESGATDLIRALTAILNRYQVPFRFKCVTHGNLFHRLDSAVLFVNRRYYKVLRFLLKEIHEAAGIHLGFDTPLFTKWLAPGLAVAEDPGTGNSFGTSRCRILAEGIWNVYARNAQSDDARLDEVLQQFRAYGVDPEHPYLNQGSVDSYDWPDQM